MGIEQRHEGAPLQISEASAAIDPRFRCLTEVDNLFVNRLPDGTYPAESLANDLLNRTTAVQEAAMQYAITESRHAIVERTTDARRERVILWMGKTTMDAVDVAVSGYDFHQHESALQRVDVEVEEAEHAQENLREGVTQLFVSPRMTRHDAPYDIAKQEHLADDDAIRLSRAVRDPHTGQLVRHMESLLIRDVPLQGWVSWARSEHNIFGQALDVSDDESALGIMRAFPQMEIADEALPQGLITVLKDMLPYIDDPEDRTKVHEHIKRFEWANQAELSEYAVSVAQRWQDFDMELSESRYAQRATFEIQRFVFGLQHEWGDSALALIASHTLPDGGLRMSRELEACIEQAKQAILFGGAGVATGNEAVLKQLTTTEAARIKESEQHIRTLQQQGRVHEARVAEMMQSRQIARNNIRVGAGCPGELAGDFGGKKKGNAESSENPDRQSEADADSDDPEDRANWKFRKGVCRVESCSSRPAETQVGPCDVCRSCQSLFDRGFDPTTYAPRSAEKPAKPPRRALLESVVWFDFGDTSGAASSAKKPDPAFAQAA